MALDVANTIIRQLGGNRFLAMTGAKNLLGSKNSLTMKIGANDRKVTHVRITLNASDLYKVEFLNIRGVQVPRLIAEHNGIYADQLQEVFTAETGMDTRL